MNQRTLENWKKVKEALEQAGKTKGDIYRRAVAVVKSGSDPGMPKMFD